MNRSHLHTTRQPLVAAAAIALAVAVLTALLSPGVASAAGPTFSITGKGYGHGIGMSQWGAQGYAKYGGKTYDWILRHYYQNTTLARRYETAGPTVKVNLASNGGSRSIWVVRSGHSTANITMYDAGDPSNDITLSGKGVFALTASASKVTVSNAVYSSGRWRAGTAIRTFPGSVMVRATEPTAVNEPALVTVKTASGPFDRTNVRWRGAIRFQPATSSTIKAINMLSVEAYLYGVVPRESPSGWHPEALKAQAVAARSYAYPSVAAGSTLWCTTMSQVYHGHSRRVASGDGVAEMHEQASTNKAIDATRGRIVVYGSLPVTTFFFSASGGHTANIEDVWTSASPKTYYTGVLDEYEATAAKAAGFGLATSWGSPIVLSGSALGAKVRSAGYGPSSSTAYVSAVQVNKADSGYVRSVVFRWSNGQRTTMPASEFRSALGLKSTKFSFSGASVLDRYQETDQHLLYTGAWTRALNSGHSGGAYKYSRATGASMKVRFSGTEAKWITKLGPSSGKAAVLLDGVQVAVVDLYSGSTKYRQTVWSRSGLTNTTHSVEIRVLGKRNTASTGVIVGIDAIDVPDGRLLDPLFDDTSGAIAYLGTWATGTDSRHVGGAYHYSKTPGSTVNLSFSGTGITWITKEKNNFGLAEVWLDGQWKQLVDLHANSDGLYRQRVFSVTGLDPAKRHLLRIRVRGEHSSASSDTYVGADAFEVAGGRLYWPTPVRVQDSVPRIVYAGRWDVRTSSKLSGGSYHLGSTTGGSAKVRFRGTKIAWVTSKRSGHGKAAVYVDGALKSVVDLYSPTTRYRQPVWSMRGLSDTEHTLEVRILGRKNPASTGYLVGFDAIDLLGDVLKPPAP